MTQSRVIDRRGRPSYPSPPRWAGRAVAAGAALMLLVGSAACVSAAPWAIRASYSLIRFTVSKSAAQGVPGGWVTRLGFVLLGLSVLIISSLADRRWNRLGRWSHRIYALAVIGAAAFSDAPWTGIAYDEVENSLHTAAAVAAGVAFSVGVLAVAFHEDRRVPAAMQLFDWAAVGAAIIVGPVMFMFAGVSGITQRIMFAIAYLWYAGEALALARSTPDGWPAGSTA